MSFNEHLLQSATMLKMIRRRRYHEAQLRRQRYFAYFRRRQRNATILMTTLLSMCEPGESVPREVSLFPQSIHWWNNIVMKSWDDKTWLENFRMSKATFQHLRHKLSPLISKKDQIMLKTIPSEQRLGIALWRLATRTSYSQLADMFGIETSFVVSIFWDVIAAINKVLEKWLISIPTGYRLKQSIKHFEDKGFPQAAAAIASCQIPMESPADNQEEQTNGMSSSTVLQVAVDGFGEFIKVKMGLPDSIHDTDVFCTESCSKLAEASHHETFTKVIEGTPVPVQVLGDSACSLMKNLMKPYSGDGDLTATQKCFNWRLKLGHDTAHKALERLMSRWNILAKTMEGDAEEVHSVILACCILHNLVERRGDPFLDEWSWDYRPAAHGAVRREDADCETSAVSIRNALTLYFMNANIQT